MKAGEFVQRIAAADLVFQPCQVCLFVHQRLNSASFPVDIKLPVFDAVPVHGRLYALRRSFSDIDELHVAGPLVICIVLVQNLFVFRLLALRLG